jgi:hypothetical protein
MAKIEKTNLPAYISPSFFSSFITGLRETHIPLQIDRSVMPKASGSQVSAMLASLRFLSLIDANGTPTALLNQLVEADDGQRPTVYKKMLDAAYGFLLNEGLDLSKASGAQVAQKFRDQGVAGSTLAKSIGFFLAVAKEAGIKVSPHIRPPAVPKSDGKKSSRQGARQSEEEEEAEESFTPDSSGETQRFQIPIPGKPSAIFVIPKDLEHEDWEMLKTMLNAYIARLQKQQGGDLI